MIGHGFWGGPAGWGIVAGLVSIVFFVLVVVILVSLVRTRPGAGPPVSSRAIRVLEERYARGEISRDEFLERRTVLTGSPKRSPGGIEHQGEPPAGGPPGSPGA
jgi:putative membrane protein